LVKYVCIPVTYRLHTAGVYLQIELDSSIFQFTIDDLDPASVYVFMLAAINKAGTSDMSNVLSAQTLDTGNNGASLQGN